MNENIKIGDIFKLTNHEKYYGIGFNNDIFIILSYDEPFYKIGCFWLSGKNIDDIGGARINELTKEDIFYISSLLGNIKDILIFNNLKKANP